MWRGSWCIAGLQSRVKWSMFPSQVELRDVWTSGQPSWPALLLWRARALKYWQQQPFGNRLTAAGSTQSYCGRKAEVFCIGGEHNEVVCVCGLGYHYECVIMSCSRIYLVSLGDTLHRKDLPKGNTQWMLHVFFLFFFKQISSLWLIKDIANRIRIPLE